MQVNGTDLKGRTAIVTGGGRGIGLAVARRFATAGARVAICGRDANALAEAAKSITAGAGSAVARACDLRDARATKDFVRWVAGEFGAINIVVNNAGISGRTPMLSEADDDEEALDRRWQEILATNLDGVYYVTRAALKHMPG
jgi:NAD(P)-dependent dehydrogenase (short-subunit alcohol dehydrogenase family)